MAREKRTIVMHENLLFSVIQDQAGSLWKAVIEGIMNSIDAGGSKCDIALSQQQLIIEDDGRGFASKAAILKFFEVFGQPHTAAEMKQYGKFRMGRGQLFAYGRNTWRSGKFEMVVDIKNKGLDYTLRSNMPQHNGCKITVELYDQLSNVMFADTCEQIKQNAKYVAVPTTLNEAQFNKPPATQRWNKELAGADIKTRTTGPLNVYNQGIFVCAYPRHRFGYSGDIVSKVPLKVNFARNDLMSDCPVWAQILRGITQQTVRRNTGTRRSTTTRTTNADRDRLANNMRDNDLTQYQTLSAKFLVKCGTRANVNARTVYDFADGAVTMPPARVTSNSTIERSISYRAWYDDVRKADKVMEHKIAYAIDPVTLGRFRVTTCAQLVALLNKHLPPNRHLNYIAFSTATKGVNTACRMLADKELTKNEAIILAVLRGNQSMLLRGTAYNTSERIVVTHRTLHMGIGPYDAWTNGKSHIVLSRAFVRRCGLYPTSWMRYAHVLMHQHLHKSSTDKAHEHSDSFYRKFHSWSGAYSPAYFAYNCAVSLGKHAAKVHKRVTQAALRRADAIARSAQIAEAQGQDPLEPFEEEVSDDAGANTTSAVSGNGSGTSNQTADAGHST